jgi:hypothetical protein
MVVERGGPRRTEGIGGGHEVDPLTRLARRWAGLLAAAARPLGPRPWPGAAAPGQGDLARAVRRARLQRKVYGRTPGNEVRG